MIFCGYAMHLPPCAMRSSNRGREAEVYQVAFERPKEFTDRALKLAEVGNPKPNWELQGVLGLAAFVLGFLAGK